MIEFNEEHANLIKKLYPEFDVSKDVKEYTDDEIIKLTDIVGDYLALECLDNNYNPNKEGLVCEEILDIIAEI